MKYFTIYANGVKIGGEFGRDESHACDRYAEGSTFERDALTAIRGVKSNGCFDPMMPDNAPHNADLKIGVETADRIIEQIETLRPDYVPRTALRPMGFSQ